MSEDQARKLRALTREVELARGEVYCCTAQLGRLHQILDKSISDREDWLLLVINGVVTKAAA